MRRVNTRYVTARVALALNRSKFLGKFEQIWSKKETQKKIEPNVPQNLEKFQRKIGRKMRVNYK